MSSEQHIVSVFPVNVEPTDDDPRTVGWRFRCTCTPRARRLPVTWLVREQCERVANAHLERVGALRMLPGATTAGRTVLKEPTATQHTQGESDAS